VASLTQFNSIIFSAVTLKRPCFKQLQYSELSNLVHTLDVLLYQSRHGQNAFPLITNTFY
jgi:hypothetical protein